MLSRDVMPVPPVVMITCTSGLASCRSTVSRTSVGFVFHDRAAGDDVAGGVSSSTMARPLVSVSLGARVADRDDEAAHRRGACALCSASLTGASAAL